MGALDGVKVLEAGLLVQGPQASATLCEWGAEVIKVELPGFGDQARWLPLAADDPRSGFYIGVNRGKKSVTVDLRNDDGREVFLKLAEWADVVITNFADGTMDEWGLGYDAVAARNPGIIYAAGTTFGFDGPEARREGADLSAQSAGGLISTTGRDGGEPTTIGVAIADHIGSQNLVSGILAALLARQRTGRGQRVTTSLVGSQIWAQASEYTAQLLQGHPAGRANRSHPLIPGIYGIFPTSDGWIAVVGIVASLREKFYDVIGRPDLGEKFPDLFYWEDDKAALFPELDAAFATATTAEWCDRLRAAGLRHAPVRTHAEVVADPTAWEQGFFRTVDGPAGPEDVVAAPVRFSDTPAVSPAFAPELGQHTEEVLLDLGFEWDEIARLKESGGI